MKERCREREILAYTQCEHTHFYNLYIKNLDSLEHFSLAITILLFFQKASERDPVYVV